ncbi:MAG: DNA polymerase III subunit alpha [Abditibacteriota bacterium]|nr:DNA polymerase III subunit alpha [Abditibacteriota bacterium]
MEQTQAAGSVPFAHLHVHSEFSILDGLSGIESIVDRAKALGMPAVALTDHGVMYGNLALYDACDKAGIKPILGCEVYVAPRSMEQKEAGIDDKNYHLVLLAKNLTGYKNLIKLVSRAFSTGFYYKPRVDKALLRTYREGLIALSACLGGELPRTLLEAPDKAEEVLQSYLDIFGKEDFYIEIQNHGIPEEEQIIPRLLALAEKTGVKAVCTNDSHYTLREDSDTHDTLLCIQTGKTKSDADRMRYEPEKYYIKSYEEMLSMFPDRPELCSNTLEIVDKCNVRFDFSRSQLPDPGVPKGMDPADYMVSEAMSGLKRRMGTEELPPEYLERFDYEARTINELGFSLYMLIVRDFTDYARQHGIYVGVRGSAASSLIGYGLGITDVDPIEYGLTFERFLNPYRAEMPDIDLDIQDNKRGDLIAYVAEKYGEECVGQISTFNQMKARGAVNDCGRALGMDLKDVRRISDMIDAGPKATISSSMESNAELKRVYDEEPQARLLLDTALKLEGVNRSRGIHAAGVLIAAQPLDELVPVEVSENGDRVAQLPKTSIERVGLLKMDFLGLINLTILANAIENVRRTKGIEIDRLKIPQDDRKTFEMLARGETNGVFQLESGGMTKNVVELKPNSVRELAAMVALFRPGPMAYIPKFIKSKFGVTPITYTHPVLEPILKETYGVICYQEQVLKIAQAVGGFALGEADILRKAMSKKKKDVMDKKKVDFIEGAAKKDIPKNTAEEIFAQIEPFAGYAFNKAHAVCYAHLAYQTAYMKANYPVEYYAALLSANLNKADKLADYIRDLKKFDITLLPPDVNKSFYNFTVEETSGGGPAIRFGLGAVKGIGQGVIDAICREREERGPFIDPADMAERTAHVQLAGKSLWEPLVKLGCFDSIFPNRQGLLTAVPQLLEHAAKLQAEKDSGQGGLFDSFDDIDISNSPDLDKYRECKEFSKDVILEFEKDLAGIYISGHPLEEKRHLLLQNSDANTRSCSELPDNARCTISGLISEASTPLSRDKKMYAKIRLEDLYGSQEIVFFPQKYEEYRDMIQKGKIAAVTVKVRRRGSYNGESDDRESSENKVELIGDEITLLGDLTPRPATGSLTVRITSPVNISEIKLLTDSYPGNDALILELDHISKVHRITTGTYVDAQNRDLTDGLRRTLGEGGELLIK